MAGTGNEILEDHINSEYKYGFTTDIEMESAPKGLNEDIVKFISAKKKEPEWMLEYRLKAFRYWQKMTSPDWAHVHYPPINFQDIIYYAAPKKQKQLNSLDGNVSIVLEESRERSLVSKPHESVPFYHHH